MKMRAPKSFLRDKRGIAALEFALLAPLMVFILFGSVVLIDALGANRRAQNATSSLADVIARDTEVTNQEVSSLWAALGVLMYPSGSTSMKACITSISINRDGNPVNEWSENRNGMDGCPFSAGSLPAAMRTPSTSVIVAQTSYAYTPPLRFLIEDEIDMKHTVYRRSRYVDPIPRVR